MKNCDFNSPSGAHLSGCIKYRYALWRNWNNDLPKCVFVMLNPSTADASESDRTITRCVNRAKSLGYGGIFIVNLFSYRTPCPSKLFSFEGDKVGNKNDDYIRYAATIANTMICAWGDNGMHQERDKVVKRMLLNKADMKLSHLGLTNSGNPLHPSARGKVQCIPYSQKPILWD